MKMRKLQEIGYKSVGQLLTLQVLQADDIDRYLMYPQDVVFSINQRLLCRMLHDNITLHLKCLMVITPN